MEFVAILGILLISFYLLKRYLGSIISFFLTKYFDCKIIKLEGCSLFCVTRAKFVLKSGISIDIENLRLNSSLLNQEHTKPISLTLDDIRIESQSTFHDLEISNKQTSSINFFKNTQEKTYRLFQFLQYAGAKIKCTNIVLLEAIPDCLLHIFFENLQLETYRCKEGLQVELSFKLAQTKLFLRNFHRSVCLAELSLAGFLSVETSETRLDLRKIRIALSNPRFSLFDDVFNYILTHRSQKPISTYADHRQFDDKNKSAPHLLDVFTSLALFPDIQLEVESLSLQFVAESTRTFCMTIATTDIEFLNKDSNISTNIRDIVLADHMSSSFLKCSQISVIFAPVSNDAFDNSIESELSNSCKLECSLLNPLLILNQQDVAWWIDYGNRLDVDLIFGDTGGCKKSVNNAEESIKFADDFSRDFALRQIELSLKDQLNKEKNVGGNNESDHLSVKMLVKSELINFRGQLKSQDGAAIEFGIDFATFVGNNSASQFEFGVENLWCHRATECNTIFNLNFSTHRWGTAVAIGAALFEFSKTSNGVQQLLVQLDECHLEWEESMVLQLVGFADLFCRSRRSASAASLDSSTLKKHEKLPRHDSWSSVDDASLNQNSENSTKCEFIFRLSAKYLSVFLTARQSLFVVISANGWRVEADMLDGLYSTCIENLYIGNSEMRQHSPYKHFPWFPGAELSNPDLQCGGVEKISVRFSRHNNELHVFDVSAFDLTWSTSAHLVLFETYITANEALKVMRKHFTFSSHNATHSSFETRPLLVNASSDSPVRFHFKLPRDHIVHWVVPSIQFEKTDNFWLLSAPTFLIEMDESVILNVEKPGIRASPADISMNLNRQEFKHLKDKTNRVWTWSANAFELVFPYNYNFSDAFDEVINSIKWIKMVHKIKSKTFRDDHRLPADVHIVFKKASLQMNDDPFEIRLQNVYEVMMDEVFERERRRQILEMKISQLKMEDPLFPKSKVDALHNSLMKKDAQIYVERIRKIQQQPHRSLLLWVWRDVDARIYADETFNSAANVVHCIRCFNPESPLSEDAEFSTLWARAIELDVAESTINFRDYPLPYAVLRDAHFWGTLVGAEMLGGDRSIRQQFVDTPSPWGRYTIERNMCPLKFYYDLSCELDELKSTYGPCWEPCLSMISMCWNFVNAPSKDPSDPLPFWDKSRLLLHGQFSMLCKRLVTSMLASIDPYNDTELVELSWENFEFDWTSGEFRIQTDLDIFVRTASKYDDSRLFHLQKCKFAIQLDWDCIGNQHDHHSVLPCAPTKLPDYSTNVKHDSFRAFRSNHVSMVMRFEVKSPSDGANSSECPQILLYANTFKFLEFMKNTLTTIYWPVKRGALFNNNSPTRRARLSAHMKRVNLTITLPRFLISYWMSFSSPFGIRMSSDSLSMTMMAILREHVPIEKNDGISRRLRHSWKFTHMSAQLEKTEIHLFGNKRQPVLLDGFVVDDSCDNDTSDSFFVGLSRLNYIREWNVPPTTKSSVVVPRSASTNSAANGGIDSEKNVVHRLTAHDLKASWTTDNRDICLAIAEGVQHAHILRKILDNEAMKVFKFNYDMNSFVGQKTFSPLMSSMSEGRPTTTGPNVAAQPSSSNSPPDDGDEMLRKLVDEARTNLVAYSEETVEHPTDSLHGVALCASDDVRLTNWQIDLLNSQLMLRCARAAGGFVLVTAARASVTQRFYHPIWRHAQLLLKRSWCAVLSGMQYFAPVLIGQGIMDNEFRWLSREIIEEKTLSDPSVDDKVNNYSSTGEAVGGVVADPFLKNQLLVPDPLLAGSSFINFSPVDVQLQRVASRCSCQLFFCYFSDTINMEKNEEEDIRISSMNQSANISVSSAGTSSGAGDSWTRHEHKRRFEEVDCFTLKHNMLEVSTNADQYQMIMDIVNSLILFVDPKKTRAEENRRRLWFRLSKKSKQYVKEQIVKMQSELREVVSIVRSLERQSYFLNKESMNAQMDLSLCAQLQAEIDEYKTRQNALVDDLATMISCYKEKEVEEEAEAHRLRLFHERIQRRGTVDAMPDADDPYDAPQALTARRFEVCFEDCIWRLTESDGQISLAEMQIRNFLYTRTARIDNSGDHLLEIGMVKVLNLLPDSKYRETLARLPFSVTSTDNTTASDRTPSIRVICRELPPVGGISIKEHFEVNIAPMNAQITYRFFEKMMAFFFPGRNIDKEEQQNLDVADEQQSQQGFSLGRRLREAVNHPFRASASGAESVADTSVSGIVATANDEIDKMKERAKKNNMFLYIIIPPVPFIVSYKGNKEKNIEDVDRFDITFPIFEYHDRNWTWLDLALAMKQRCKRIILPQLLKQKLLRKRIIGAERVSLPIIDAVDEDEKRRIVLGTSNNDEKSKRKKKA